MMYALDKVGRLPTAIAGLIAAAIMSLIFWQSRSEAMLLITGFLMFFCMQTGTNAMLIYTGEIFPTNAQASGLGIALGVSQLGALVSGYTVVFIQPFGTPAVFVFMAALLLVGAVAVLMIGRETKGLALDTIAPPCEQTRLGDRSDPGSNRTHRPGPDRASIKVTATVRRARRELPKQTQRSTPTTVR